MRQRRIVFAVIASGALAVLALAQARAASPPKVWAEKGSIYIEDSGGKPRQLTRGAHDRDPVLSPDGTKIAFIQSSPAVSNAKDETSLDLLFILDLNTGKAERAVDLHASDKPQDNFTSLNFPAFSPDGRTVYVLAHAWVTSDAVHAVNLTTHRQRYIAPANDLKVIMSGRYKGDLLVNQHLYYTGGEGGSYDPYLVLTPAGKKVLMIRNSDSDDSAVAAWLKRNS